MGHASRTDRGGGTEPLSCWPRGASPARRPSCPAVARRGSRRGGGGAGGPAGAQGPGLAADVASARQVLTASDEPTVVVAHSYGGIVTAEAAAGGGGGGDMPAALPSPT